MFKVGAVRYERNMKTIIFCIAKYTGVFALCRWLTRKQIRILAYHGVWLGDDHYGNFLYISPQKFAERMQKIKKMGLPVIGLNKALVDRDKGELPDCPVVITIDDGWYGTYLHMLPELEKNEFPSTLYMTTYYSEIQAPVYNVLVQYMITTTSQNIVDIGVLGGEEEVFQLSNSGQRQKLYARLESLVDSADVEYRYDLIDKVSELLKVDLSRIISEKWFHLASFDQVRDMAHRGIDVQLHTHRHRISKGGDDCLEQELTDNRLRLEPLTGKPLVHFCYPSGVYDRSVWPSLKANDVVSATTTEAGFVNKQSHIYALPRILDGENVSDLEFEAELSGFNEIKRQLSRFLN